MASRCFHAPSLSAACNFLPKVRLPRMLFSSKEAEAITNKYHEAHKAHSASSFFLGAAPAESSASPLLPPQPSLEGLRPHSWTRRRVPGWCSCTAGWSCYGRRTRSLPRANTTQGQLHFQALKPDRMPRKKGETTMKSKTILKLTWKWK